MLTSRHLPPQRFNKTTQNTRKNFELDQNCLRFGGRLHVRFGSKADIGALPINVRFTPKSGHWNSVVEYPLCAKSGHWPPHIREDRGSTSTASFVLPLVP